MGPAEPSQRLAECPVSGEFGWLVALGAAVLPDQLARPPL
jgi:hypothetical protein